MPIDFAALRKQNAERLQQLKSEYPKKTLTEEVESEFHKGLTPEQAIEELLENGQEVNGWEREFLHSIRNWMLSPRYTGLSVKQKHTFEKICRNNNLQFPTSAIPTKDNRYATNEYVAPYENRNSAPVKNFGFDNYDDDIPF